MAEVVSEGLVDRAIVVDRNANVLAGVEIAGDRGAAVARLRDVMENGRDTAVITQGQARAWLRELVDNADVLAARGKSDPDLLATVDRLAVPARQIAGIGWPGDAARAEAETQRAGIAVAAVRAGQGARSALRERITERFDSARQERGPGAG